MTKPLQRFRTTIDALPGAETDRRDWRIRLGVEFAWAGTFLRTTGQRATAIDCPSPGDDGCPRGVIRTAGGGLRAVCRSAVGRCDAVELVADEIDVLRIDLERLCRALAIAFELQEAPRPISFDHVVTLGAYAIAAGVATPVMLVLPGPAHDIQIDQLQAAGLGRERTVLLVPRIASLPVSIQARLVGQGHLVLSLADVTRADGKGGVVLVQPVDLLLHDILTALRVRVDTAHVGPIVALPPGARWGELTLVLISDEVLLLICRGQTLRLEPDRMGMKDGRTGKPTSAWIFLQVLARTNGVLGPLDRDVIEQHKKRKQALSRQLARAFGIGGDPIRWRKKDRAYETTFLIRDERPKAARRICSHR